MKQLIKILTLPKELINPPAVQIHIYPHSGNKVGGKANPHLVEVRLNGAIYRSLEFSTNDLVNTFWLAKLEKEIITDLLCAQIDNSTEQVNSLDSILRSLGFQDAE